MQTVKNISMVRYIKKPLKEKIDYVTVARVTYIWKKFCETMDFHKIFLSIYID